MTYDLVVVGNGIAAQTFLWSFGQNLLSDAKKRQNFSIAQVYSENLAPACTVRSTATVSLNGVEENVSELGNDLRDSFFRFETLFKTQSPAGVLPVKQTVICTNDKDRAKMVRRFKTLETIQSTKFQQTYDGVEINSYLLQPELLGEWFKKESGLTPKIYPWFVKNFKVTDDHHYELILENQKILKAKKVVFAGGAFTKIFAHFLSTDMLPFNEEKNTIKAGSFLQKTCDLGDESFLLTIDQHQVNYKAPEKKLMIGTSMTVGFFGTPDLKVLHEVFLKCKTIVSFNLGNFDDYEIVTGLRHKGPRRKYIAEKMHPDHEVYLINGFYKNGYTLSLLAAEKICLQLNL